MTMVINSSNLQHEKIYDYFADRQDKGRFDHYSQDMLTFINQVWNNKLGVVAAMSHSGIGGDITNGFVQFVCDDPSKFHSLVCRLTQLRDQLPRADQPLIEIRSKSIPNGLDLDGFGSYVTVMLRTPKFRNQSHATKWWASLAEHQV